MTVNVIVKTKVALKSNFDLSYNGRAEDEDRTVSTESQFQLKAINFSKVNLKKQSDCSRGMSTDKVCLKDKEPQRNGKWAEGP